MATKSLIAIDRSLIQLSDHVQTIKEIHPSPKGTIIRDCVTKAILMGPGVAHGLEVEVLKVGTLHVSHINISVSLVGLLIPHFRLSMGVILVTVIILARAGVSLLRHIFWVF